jgi:hypothetical protein
VLSRSKPEVLLRSSDPNDTLFCRLAKRQIQTTHYCVVLQNDTLSCVVSQNDTLSSVVCNVFRGILKFHTNGHWKIPDLIVKTCRHDTSVGAAGVHVPSTAWACCSSRFSIATQWPYVSHLHIECLMLCRDDYTIPILSDISYVSLHHG